MISNLKKQLLFGLLCVAFSSQINGWTEHLSEINWPSFAKEVSCETAKTTALICGAVFVFANISPLLTKNITESKYPKAFAFIKEELEKAGLDSNDITIKGVAPYSWATVSTLFGTYLFAPENDLIEIENMLTEHPNSSLLNRIAL